MRCTDMRVLFVLPRMVSGGVERVTLNLIRTFTADGIECKLAIRNNRGELLDEARTLTDVLELAPHGLYQFVPRLVHLLRAWHPTHVITAFSDVGLLTWVALRLSGRNTHWIHGVHNTHSSVTIRPGLFGRLRYSLDNYAARFVYRHADATVAVSNGVREEVLTWFHADPKRVTTIYNPVVTDDQISTMREARRTERHTFNIVGLGRLTRQKGFDILIKSMTEVPPPWQLDIWGDGSERENLNKLIADAGLQSSIHLRGHTNRPLEIMRNADLFVLASRYEGLPTVLIEALACQCQIVATDCPQGPREILEDGKLGQLVVPEDIHGLADAIRKTVSGEVHVDARLLFERAQQFTVTAAATKWIGVLSGVQTRKDDDERRNYVSTK